MLKGSSKNSIGLDWISGNKNEKLASENADTGTGRHHELNGMEGTGEDSIHRDGGACDLKGSGQLPLMLP